MFRNIEKAEMHNDHFGVGSIICHEGLGRRAQWLVISHVFDSQVGLLDLDTMKCVLGSIPVADENYLTETEAHALVRILGEQHQCTFSDYTLISAGLKFSYVRG